MKRMALTERGAEVGDRNLPEGRRTRMMMMVMMMMMMMMMMTMMMMTLT